MDGRDDFCREGVEVRYFAMEAAQRARGSGMSEGVVDWPVTRPVHFPRHDGCEDHLRPADILGQRIGQAGEGIRRGGVRERAMVGSRVHVGDVDDVLATATPPHHRQQGAGDPHGSQCANIASPRSIDEHVERGKGALHFRGENRDARFGGDIAEQAAGSDFARGMPERCAVDIGQEQVGVMTGECACAGQADSVAGSHDQDAQFCPTEPRFGVQID